MNSSAQRTRYDRFSHDEFDAIVTGELTHYALWLEDVLITIVSDFFVKQDRRTSFERLVLRRDGLAFQDKIEIVRAMLALFGDEALSREMKTILAKIEEFKASRNALAHGRDTTPESMILSACLHVEVVNRAGKEKTVEVTPESHLGMLSNAEILLRNAERVAKQLRGRGGRRSKPIFRSTAAPGT